MRREHKRGSDMRFLAALLSICLCLASMPAFAIGTEKTALRDGFAFPKNQPIRILVFRPDVHVGEQGAGGVNTPKADWTDEARKQLGAALERQQSSLNNNLVSMPELEGESGMLLADYRALFQAVTNSVMVHKLFPGNRLPTKKESFDWTVGPGAAKLGELGGGDYALFIYTFDSYGSAARKAMQLMGAMFGVGLTSGVHIGYAGLIDLKTGDLVWINADVQMGGDVREADGADKRIAQLLEGFPGRAVGDVQAVEN